MAYIAYFKILLEISILWYVLYMILLLIKGTRTEQLLKGILIIGIIFVITQQMGLEVINWVLTRIFPISIIVVFIIFQPELRRGLARLGQFGIHQENIEAIDEIVKAAVLMSDKRIGALIAIEKEAGLKTYVESGVAVDSKVTSELVHSIFLPQAPLHDGAVIIQHGRLAAAGCLLPLTQEEQGLPKSLGTRHRAALGLAEETDAVCVVVSEETGSISIAVGGKLNRNLDEKGLTKALKGAFYRPGKRLKYVYKDSRFLFQ